MRVLILGGTTEASAIARALAGDPRFAPTLSLAGRTVAPVAPPIAFRVGGFGGADGLAAYLAAERIEALIDATHPFAAIIRRNAALAAARIAIPRIAVLRPEWSREPGDEWRDVASMREAFEALGAAPRRVFLTVGQQELAPFGPPHRYLVRSVDPPSEAALPPGATVIAARGPFATADEIVLMRHHRIDILVTKNSGGTATAAKLAAARALCVPVVMVARPPPLPAPDGAQARTAAEALDWLAHQAGLPCWRGV